MSPVRLLPGIALFMSFALSGCTVLPPRAPAPVSNDFGPPTSSPIRSAAIALGEVTSPAWLETGKILYRLAKDPTALRSYATQRWISAPDELLGQRLRERLLGPERQGYRLDARLDRFEQEFARNGTARAILVLRATILAPGGRILASHWFTLSTPTRPDVHGAVQGLSMLAREVSAAIVRWANRIVRMSGR